MSAGVGLFTSDSLCLSSNATGENGETERLQTSEDGQRTHFLAAWWVPVWFESQSVTDAHSEIADLL